MAKTICEHSVNRFLNCSTARPCNMTAPPFTLQGTRNLLSGLILKYLFLTPKWPLPMIILQFSEKGLCLSTPRTLKGGTDRPVLLSCGPSHGRPVTGCLHSNLDNIFQNSYLLEKKQFQAFWKSYFCKMFPLTELLKLVVAIKVP